MTYNDLAMAIVNESAVVELDNEFNNFNKLCESVNVLTENGILLEANIGEVWKKIKTKAGKIWKGFYTWLKKIGAWFSSKVEMLKNKVKAFKEDRAAAKADKVVAAYEIKIDEMKEAMKAVKACQAEDNGDISDFVKDMKVKELNKKLSNLKKYDDNITVTPFEDYKKVSVKKSYIKKNWTEELLKEYQDVANVISGMISNAEKNFTAMSQGLNAMNSQEAEGYTMDKNVMETYKLSVEVIGVEKSILSKALAIAKNTLTAYVANIGLKDQESEE